MIEKDDYIIIGKIVKPQGLKGEIKATPYISQNIYAKKKSAERFNLLKQVYIKGEEYVVETVKHLNNGIVLKLSGVNNRDEAEKMRGKLLEIPKDEWTKKSEDEYFFYELENMKVVTEKNEELGIVSEVLDMPANAALEVKKKNGQEILIPFIKDVIKRVDSQNGIIYIDLIKGLG
ncbi:MAG TPA: ribosome maturation factor RimM [bacterium]|mgnify:CR=1 FL=1|nr:ribosome maturation factor RimM [bacterium]HPN29629.1 ribosome maturation factor RimM [bacterium]